MSDTALCARWSALRSSRRTALIAYLTAGYPDGAQSLDALHAVVGAGADIVEFGMPFSDPLADGPIIQASTHAALKAGMTLDGMLRLVDDAHLEVPIIAFGYLNPVLQYGIDRFLVNASEVGIAGLLLTDLPAGEDPAVEKTVRASGLPLIPVVAPTTTDERLARVLPEADGFVYAIARLGVTGARTDVGADASRLVARVRAHTSLPVALGFGIGDAHGATAAARIADGVVVGSALVERLSDGGVEAVRALIAQLREALDRSDVDRFDTS